MRVPPICGVPCARQACGQAAEDCLLLQEQLAFVTAHLALLCGHHQQLCQQQQQRVAEASALAVRSPAWVATMTQIRTQSRRHTALWEDIHAWVAQARALQAQLGHLRGRAPRGDTPGDDGGTDDDSVSAWAAHPSRRERTLGPARTVGIAGGRRDSAACDRQR